MIRNLVLLGAAIFVMPLCHCSGVRGDEESCEQPPEIETRTFEFSIVNHSEEPIFIDQSFFAAIELSHDGAPVVTSPVFTCSCEICRCGQPCYQPEFGPGAWEVPEGEALQFENELARYTFRENIGECDTCSVAQPLESGTYEMTLTYGDLESIESAGLEVVDVPESSQLCDGCRTWRGHDLGFVSYFFEQTHQTELIIPREGPVEVEFVIE